MRARLLGPLALIAAAGCGSDPLNTGDISQSEALALTNQIARIGLAGVASHSSPSAGGSPAVARSPSREVDFPVAYVQGCIESGTIQVTGSVAGTLDDATGDGVLTVDVSAAMQGCTMSVQGRRFVISGSVAISGSFVYAESQPAADQRARLRGDFSWTSTPGGPGSCHLDLQAAYNIASGFLAMAGSTCGYQVAV